MGALLGGLGRLRGNWVPAPQVLCVPQGGDWVAVGVPRWGGGVGCPCGQVGPPHLNWVPH